MALYVDGQRLGTNPRDRAPRRTPATGGSAATPSGWPRQRLLRRQIDGSIDRQPVDAVLVYSQAASSGRPRDQPPVAHYPDDAARLCFNGTGLPTGGGVHLDAARPVRCSFNVRSGSSDRGATWSKNVSHGVTLSVANQPPMAAFTSSCTTWRRHGRIIRPDGTVAGYAWSFGDGATGVGHQPHLRDGGTIRSLTVTDNLGSAATVNAVKPDGPSGHHARLRLVQPHGHRRPRDGEPRRPLDLGSSCREPLRRPGAASFTLPTASTDAAAYLGGVSNTNTETDVTLTTDKTGTGGGIYAYVVGRRISFNNEYHARLNIVGTKVTLSLSRLTGAATDVADRRRSQSDRSHVHAWPAATGPVPGHRHQPDDPAHQGLERQPGGACGLADHRDGLDGGSPSEGPGRVARLPLWQVPPMVRSCSRPAIFRRSRACSRVSLER